MVLPAPPLQVWRQCPHFPPGLCGDQALSLWSGSTDSKTLDYQRTNLQYSSFQSLSRVRLFATPWIAAHQASLSITNSLSLLKFMPIKSVMPSSHFILCRPLLLLPPIPPSIRVFSNVSTLRMKWPKYWSFSFSIRPSNEHPGLISFRMNWLDLLAVQGTNLTHTHISLSHVRLFATPWTVAHQAPPSMGFSRKEYWSGLPFPPPGDLPNPGIELRSPALQAEALTSEPPGKPSIKQWELTQRKPLEYKTWHHPTTSSTLWRTPHLNHKQNKNTNPIISKQDYHFTHPCALEEKQMNKNSAQISPYTKLTQATGPTSEWQKPKGRKN